MTNHTAATGAGAAGRAAVPAAIPLFVLLMLTACCVSWFTLDPLKYVYVDVARAGGSTGDLLRGAREVTGFVDLALLVAAAGMLAALVLLEARRRALSRALLEAGLPAQLLVLLVLACWFGHSLLTPGLLVGGDASSHIARIAHVRMLLEDGRIVFWNNYHYGGSTLLLFTGPLYFLVGGVADLLAREPNLTSKLLLFAGHLLSTAAFFWLLRRHYAGVAALLGAILYGGSLSHLQQVLWDGNHPQAFTYLLLPLSWMLLTALLQGAKRARTVWLALTLVNALLFLHHQSMAKATGIYLVLHSAAYLALNLRRWPVLMPLAASATVSVLLAAVVIGPVFADRWWVMMYERVSLLILNPPTLHELVTLLRWDPTPTVSESFMGFVGLFIVIAGLTSRRAFEDRTRVWLSISGLAGLLLSVFDDSQHVKTNVFTLFFFALLVGHGADALLRGRPWQRRTLYLLALLMFLEVSSTAIQPINRLDKTYLQNAAAALAAAEPAGRVLMTTTWGGGGRINASIGPGGGILTYYRVPNVIGAHNLAAPRTHNYNATTIKLAEEDLQACTLGEAVSALLALMNVRLIVNDTGRSMGLPPCPGISSSSPLLGSHHRLELHPDVVLAQQAREAAPPAEYDKPLFWNGDFSPPSKRARELRDYMLEILEAMEYDYRTGMAERVFLRQAPPGEEAGAAVPPPPAQDRPERLAVTGHEVGHASATMVVAVPLSGFLRLPYPWTPTLSVEMDGTPVEAAPDAFFYAVLPITPGIREIRIRYGATAAQLWYSLLSLLTLLAVTSWYFLAPTRGARAVREDL